MQNVLIYSRARCSIVDRVTWESLKRKGVKCQSRKAEKKLFAYGQTKPIEVVGTFEREIYCEESGEMYVDEFTLVEGHGKALLYHRTRHRHTRSQVQDILKRFADVFTGVGKLKDYQIIRSPGTSAVLCQIFTRFCPGSEYLQERINSFCGEMPIRNPSRN